MAADSTYGQKPLYYGTSKSSPIYYGSSKAPYYYGNSGGKSAPYYYGGGSGSSGQDPDSLVGTVTIGRILRVVAQRWISILVFLLIGLVAAFAVYRISETIYEAKSEFTIDMRRPQQTTGLAGAGMVDMPDYGNSYEEVFNTRLSDWRSDKILTKIIQQYRADYPASTVTDGELMSTLAGSTLELVRHSRLITIAVRSHSANLAASLANAYAQAIEAFTDEENKLRCDKAVTQVHEQVEKQRRTVERVSKQLLDFRTANKLDNMRAEQELLNQTLSKTTAEILTLESEVTAAEEWVKVLEAAQETPEDFGALPTAVPRSSEIAKAYDTYQTAQMECNSLLTTLTKQHPEVILKQKQLDVYKQQFVEAVVRALATAKGNLQAYKNQLAEFRTKFERVRTESAALAQRIIGAESGFQQLTREQEVADTLYKSLLQSENEARIRAEQNNEIVRIGRPASTPSKPVLPNPILIFVAGIVLSLGAGLLFVLILDHLEDTIVSLHDIEGRLALKVLAVLPHVRRKKREQVARFISEEKYSQFAEAVAGLRNLLDSPRYRGSSQVLLLMSTQPGEGKTITSCSLATSCAQAAKKTLLVDFDLRRPRIQRVWNVNIDEAHSFSHCLQKATDLQKVDFSSIVNPSGVTNLDIICSLPPDGVDPASIMGSHVVPEFFAWARANYDRVIIDSPPYGIVGDVMTLAAMVDSVMILCCPDRTRFKPIRHASRNLAEAGATVIGVIVNDVELGGSAFSQTGNTYGYSKYGGYGYSPKHGYSPYAPGGVKRTAPKTVSGEKVVQKDLADDED